MLEKLDRRRGGIWVRPWNWRSASSSPRVVFGIWKLESGASSVSSASLAVTHSVTPSAELYHAAMNLRSSVLNLKNQIAWLPRAIDVTEEDIRIPSDLYNFLAWILGGGETAFDFTSNTHPEWRLMHGFID